jgi:hypothetical protein
MEMKGNFFLSVFTPNGTHADRHISLIHLISVTGVVYWISIEIIQVNTAVKYTQSNNGLIFLGGATLLAVHYTNDYFQNLILP